MEEDHDIPLLLGRPFLTIAGTLKDVQQGTLTLSDHTMILLDKAIVRKEFAQQPKQYVEEVAFFATSAPP
ncbi:hypothetical protein L3X38_015311 [Prunus dulcis]|uniref:Uncharacterized protein n=1 Tax=Prunus dulcis TaxID=3755 RepID=A0AAD4WSF6_PRUDU|nr:hypothetical protein L3X38_015311 [Prunus dulcis]